MAVGVTIVPLAIDIPELSPVAITFRKLETLPSNCG
jgi:hypothetical protein